MLHSKINTSELQAQILATLERGSMRASDLQDRFSRYGIAYDLAFYSLLFGEKIVIWWHKYRVVGLPQQAPGEALAVVGKLPKQTKLVTILEADRRRLASQEQQRQEQEIANQERAEREREAFELKQLQAGAAIDDEWTRHYSSRKQTLQQHAEKMRTTPDYSVLEAQRREFFKQQWSRLFAGQPLPDLVKAEFGV